MDAKRLLLLAAGLWLNLNLQAQLTLQVIVETGDASTACTDPITGPDPMWGISVADGPWAYFPPFLVCYTPLPHVAYSASFDCPADLPATIEVCLRAFENDPDLFAPCDINPDCIEQICTSLPVSLTPTTHLVEMPDGLSSDGWAQLRIEVTGTPIDALNDSICAAQSLGTLTFGQTLGNAEAGGMSNFCGTNAGDPNPFDQPGVYWHNNVGVWFHFQTGPDVSDLVRIRARNDPLGLGDTISLQLGLYTTADGTCAGTPQWVAGAYTPQDDDETLWLACQLLPNTDYYLLVDGVVDQAGKLHGYFGIEVSDLGVVQGGNLRCQATNLGNVPQGGTLSSQLTTNACADNTDDPPDTGFPTQQTVWFQFTPPPSGNVRIEATSHPADPIALQLALYASDTDDCSGTYALQAFSFTPDQDDEVLEISCLEPRPYFLMVDGASNNPSGIFQITLRDGGFSGPLLSQNVTLCAGDSLIVGNSVYTASGQYADTIPLNGTCDSVVLTSLTVLEPILPGLAILQEASAYGTPDGSATLMPQGGAGGYTYLWSHGPTTDTVFGLSGGQQYCLTVTDTLGCPADTCFEMPVVPAMSLLPIAQTPTCAEHADGRIGLFITGGFPPYYIAWQGSSLSGNDTLTQAADTIWINHLAEDTYLIHASDGLTDTTFTLYLSAPPPLSADILTTPPTCFGWCDGQIELIPQGGTPPWSISWADGDTSLLRPALCAGTWTATLTDANGCALPLTATLDPPPPFEAAIALASEISCADSHDGALSIQTTTPPAAILWNTGDTTALLSNLSAGLYAVTVTQAAGCADSASFWLEAPPPLEASITTVEPVRCHGTPTAVLEAAVEGPHPPFAFTWNDGRTSPQIDSASAGTWTVTVVNARGCADTTSLTLDQPAPLQLFFQPDPIDCLEGPTDGLLLIDSATGGTPPYEIAANDRPFVPLSDIDGLEAGSVPLLLRDARNCLLDTTAYIPGPPDFQAELGAQLLEITLGTPVDLQPASTSNHAVFTFLTDSLVCQACPTLQFLPLASTAVVLLATDTLTHCTDTDTLYILVRKPRRIYAPNAFSPDGDGFNERFTLFGSKEVLRIELLQVFDRFGTLVYEGKALAPNDLQTGWNGTIRGRPAPPAVYVWRAHIRYLDGFVETRWGEVILLR